MAHNVHQPPSSGRSSAPSSNERLGDDDALDLDDSEHQENAAAVENPRHSPVDIDSLPDVKAISAAIISPVISISGPRCCREKIIICLDVSQELENVRMTLTDGQRLNTLERMKKVVRMFVSLKSLQAGEPTKHQFALVLLADEPFWRCDLQPGTAHVLDALHELDVHTLHVNGRYSLDTLFHQICASVPLPTMQRDGYPDCYLRLIIFFGRQNHVPIFTDTEALRRLYGCPYFFIDVVYLHPGPADTNRVEDTRRVLQRLDNGQSYIMSVDSNVTELHHTMSCLLFSPALRRSPDKILLRGGRGASQPPEQPPAVDDSVRIDEQGAGADKTETDEAKDLIQL